MGTIAITQAGISYKVVQSNIGLRVEHLDDGEWREILVHRPGEVVTPPADPEPVDPPAEEPDEEAPAEEEPGEGEGEEGETEEPGEGEGEETDETTGPGETGGETPAPTPTPIPTPTPVPAPPSASMPPRPTGGVSVTPGTYMAAVKRREPVLILEDGDYGTLYEGNLKGAEVKIYARNPGKAVFRRMYFGDGCENISFWDVDVVNAELNQSEGQLWRTLPSARNINFYGGRILGWSDLAAAPRMKGKSPYHWTRAEWVARERGGIYNQGPACDVIGTEVVGVRFGITAEGAGSKVIGNVVRGFSEDAIRAVQGTGIEVRDNRGHDYFAVYPGAQGRHPDLIQCFSRGADGKAGTGIFTGAIIENNKLAEWVGPDTHWAHDAVQGGSGFDGMFDQFQVRGNVFVASMYHGMAWAGMTNSVIEDNLIIDPKGLSTAGYPWILVSAHKDGRPSANNIVRRNGAERITVERAGQPALQMIGTDGNFVPPYPYPGLAALLAEIAA